MSRPPGETRIPSLALGRHESPDDFMPMDDVPEPSDTQQVDLSGPNVTVPDSALGWRDDPEEFGPLERPGPRTLREQLAATALSAAAGGTEGFVDQPPSGISEKLLARAVQHRVRGHIVRHAARGEARATFGEPIGLGFTTRIPILDVRRRAERHNWIQAVDDDLKAGRITPEQHSTRINYLRHGTGASVLRVNPRDTSKSARYLDYEHRRTAGIRRTDRSVRRAGRHTERVAGRATNFRPNQPTPGRPGFVPPRPTIREIMPKVLEDLTRPKINGNGREQRENEVEHKPIDPKTLTEPSTVLQIKRALQPRIERITEQERKRTGDNFDEAEFRTRVEHQLVSGQLARLLGIPRSRFFERIQRDPTLSQIITQFDQLYHLPDDELEQQAAVTKPVGDITKSTPDSGNVDIGNDASQKPQPKARSKPTPPKPKPQQRPKTDPVISSSGRQKRPTEAPRSTSSESTWGSSAAEREVIRLIADALLGREWDILTPTRPTRPAYEQEIDREIAGLTKEGMTEKQARRRVARKYHTDTAASADPNAENKIRYINGLITDTNLEQRRKAAEAAARATTTQTPAEATAPAETENIPQEPIGALPPAGSTGTYGQEA